ncbi:hypothetical protein ACFMQL_29075 [Nonomuraea fastidiosa]|jgi:hypothetical protein|uniref:hypothetical protein n=1 Tax=Nonomuraea TaxID=83681 RepID=UPI0032529C88
MDKLDSSPFPGDLREELAVRPARGVSKVTLALGAGVVLVAGILIGIQAHSAFGSTSRAGAGPQAGPLAGAARQATGEQAGAGQRARQPGRFGGQGRGAGGTAGTIEKVEDGTIHLKTAAGETVTVATTGETTVLISKPGELADLKAGDTIVVRGTPGAGGAVTATSITQGGPAPRGGGPR